MSLEKKDWVLGYLDKLDRKIQNFITTFVFFFNSSLFSSFWRKAEQSLNIPFHYFLQRGWIRSKQTHWQYQKYEWWCFVKYETLQKPFPSPLNTGKVINIQSLSKSPPSWKNFYNNKQQGEMWKCKCQLQFFAQAHYRILEELMNVWNMMHQS